MKKVGKGLHPCAKAGPSARGFLCWGNRAEENSEIAAVWQSAWSYNHSTNTFQEQMRNKVLGISSGGVAEQRLRRWDSSDPGMEPLSPNRTAGPQDWRLHLAELRSVTQHQGTDWTKLAKRKPPTQPASSHISKAASRWAPRQLGQSSDETAGWCALPDTPGTNTKQHLINGRGTNRGSRWRWYPGGPGLQVPSRYCGVTLNGSDRKSGW